EGRGAGASPSLRRPRPAQTLDEVLGTFNILEGREPFGRSGYGPTRIEPHHVPRLDTSVFQTLQATVGRGQEKTSWAKIRSTDDCFAQRRHCLGIASRDKICLSE